MIKISKIIDSISALIGMFTGYFLGGITGIMYALLTLMFIDYITGILCAYESKTLSSKTGFKGLLKKVFIIFLVGIANIVDTQIFPGSNVFRTGTVFFYICNEALSIIENGLKLGIPVPKKLKIVFEQLREKENNDNDVQGN